MTKLQNAPGTSEDQAHSLAQSRLARAQRLARLGHWEWDLRAQSLTWSEPLYGLFGWPPGHPLTADGIVAMIHPDDRARNQAFVEALLAGDQPPVLHFRLLRADGTIRHVRQLVEVERGPDGAPARFFGTMQDISDEQQLWEAMLHAERLATLGQLAAGVAHEINNPLSLVLYDLEYLHEELGRQGPATSSAVVGGSSGTEVATCLEEALAAARRITVFMRGLAALSQREPGEPSRTELGLILDRALLLAQHELKYRLRLDAQLDERGPVLASTGPLTQAFLNLVLTFAAAIEVGDTAHHELRITSARDGEQLSVSFTARGPRLQVAALEQALQAPERSGARFGPAAGPAVARSIIEAAGGQLSLAARTSDSLRLVVRLPAAPAAASAHDSRSLPAASSACRGRLLVIDDDAGMRRVLGRLLRQHEVVLAESGARAQDLLDRDARFDVVICDVMMPQVSGVDLHRWLAAHQPALARRLIFVTGGAFTDDTRAYLAALPNARLEKPLDPAELRAAITALLQHPERALDT